LNPLASIDEFRPLLFHYGPFQPVWRQRGLIQCGPRLADGRGAIHVRELAITGLRDSLNRSNLPAHGVLLHYTDPFLMRAQPLRGLRHWFGPRLLVCGDLHHGECPLDVLAAYLEAEPHDAVLLTFNPAMLSTVRLRLRVPVRALPPTFFRYPAAEREAQPRLELLHVGSLGPHHPRRRELVTALQARGRVPFRHATTSSSEEAAALYAQHALVLNVPLNHDLNHRFFEVMAAGVPQVVFGDPGLVGEHRHLTERPDVFWASTLEELEALVLGLFAEPERLRTIPVAPPPYWELKDLLKAAFAP
jgi:hypothetical protein